MFQGLAFNPFTLPPEAEALRADVRKFLAESLDPPHFQTLILMQATLQSLAKHWGSEAG